LDHRARWISIGGLAASISAILIQTSPKWRLNGMHSEQSQLSSLRIEILIAAVLQDRLMWTVYQKTPISYLLDCIVRYNDLFYFWDGWDRASLLEIEMVKENGEVVFGVCLFGGGSRGTGVK
jgi:hypothetical protein